MVGGQLCGFVGRWTGCLRPWLAPERAARGLAPALVDLPFATQLRHRLVQLGPTYIKLGQIMAVCEDILPHRVTDELKNLFDQAPAAFFTSNPRPDRD